GLGPAVAETLLRVLLEERLEVLADVGLQRGQDLPELDRGRRLLDRNVAAILDRRRVRRARLQVHEEVALEEDARPDLELRVLVDRQALLVDLHRDPG